MEKQNSKFPIEKDFEPIVIRSDANIESPINGYGRCHSCNCQGWIPNNPPNDYCNYCKHHWERHW